MLLKYSLKWFNLLLQIFGQFSGLLEILFFELLQFMEIIWCYASINYNYYKNNNSDFK